MEGSSFFYLVLVVALLVVWMVYRLLFPKTSRRGSVEVAQSDAEHFADLLVSEIATYNVTKLSEGIRRRNIIGALGDEIESARVVYEQRFGVPRPGTRDFFKEALVRILARGDEGALGRAPLRPDFDR